MKPLLPGLVTAALLAAASAWADPPAAAQPDDSVLGTVEVNGSAEGLPPLPKMAIVPIVVGGQADSLVNLVVRGDRRLRGQFDVLDESLSPSGPFTTTTPLDLVAWRDIGAEYLLRVFARPAADDSSKTELVGEAYLTPTPAQAAALKARMAAGTAPPRSPSPRLRLSSAPRLRRCAAPPTASSTRSWARSPAGRAASRAP